jgi:hypothetical protein
MNDTIIICSKSVDGLNVRMTPELQVDRLIGMFHAGRHIFLEIAQYISCTAYPPGLPGVAGPKTVDLVTV